MKPLSLLIIFVSLTTNASVDSILNNKKLENPMVIQSFNLRASDGSVIAMTPADPRSLQSVSLIGKTLQFSNQDGKLVNFAVDSLPEDIEDFSDLYNVSIKAATSNQNLGVSIFHSSDNNSLAPSTRITTEACSITSQVRTCDPNGRCWTQTITQTGTHTVTSTTTFILKSYYVAFSNAQFKNVYVGEISQGKFETTKDNSACILH